MMEKLDIPDDATLLLAVHSQYCNQENCKNGDVEPTAFVAKAPPGEVPNGLSVNWEQFSSPEITIRQFVAKKPENANRYGVVRFGAGQTRKDGISVEHDPDEERDNFAHTLVGIATVKPLLTEQRQKLARQAIWVIKPTEWSSKK